MVVCSCWRVSVVGCILLGVLCTQATGAPVADQQSITVTDFSQKSSSVSGSPSPHLLIAVMTAPKHFDAREAIRNTWAKYLTNNNNTTTTTTSSTNSSSSTSFPTYPAKVDVKFFVGNQSDASLEPRLSKEAERDLVRLTSFTESYLNLTRKTIGIAAWAKDNGYDAVLKVDDDTFVRVDNLFRFLEKKNLRKIYSGHIQCQGSVMDNPSSKWYMRDQYPTDYFPCYAFGPCYLLGTNLVDMIASNRDTLFPYRVEDAGVAIWAESHHTDIVRQEMPSFLYNADCHDVGEDVVFISPVNAKEMQLVMRNAMMGRTCGPANESPFVLEECRENRCRCWPPPEHSCFSEFANDEYNDVIPRLLQTQAVVTSSRESLD